MIVPVDHRPLPAVRGGVAGGHGLARAVGVQLGAEDGDAVGGEGLERFTYLHVIID